MEKHDPLKISIVGHGFVGKAVEYGFDNGWNDIQIIDPKYGNSVEDIETFKPNLTFVCGPTPMGENRRIDDSIIRDICDKLHNIPSGVVVVKSTIIPNVIREICRTPRFVYNPEFLTERNAYDEFVNPTFHIFGGDIEYTRLVDKYYKYHSNCNPAPSHYMTLEEASLVKYSINSFLASKVVWFNELRDLADTVGARYNVISSVISSDPRVGKSHTKVPGFDKKRGYGGSCFPKDTTALLRYSEDMGSPMKVLRSVVDKNDEYRSQYDLDDREKEQKVFFKKTE